MTMRRRMRRIRCAGIFGHVLTRNHVVKENQFNAETRRTRRKRRVFFCLNDSPNRDALWLKVFPAQLCALRVSAFLGPTSTAWIRPRLDYCPTGATGLLEDETDVTVSDAFCSEFEMTPADGITASGRVVARSL